MQRLQVLHLRTMQHSYRVKHLNFRFFFLAHNYTICWLKMIFCLYKILLDLADLGVLACTVQWIIIPWLREKVLYSRMTGHIFSHLCVPHSCCSMAHSGHTYPAEALSPRPAHVLAKIAVLHGKQFEPSSCHVSHVPSIPAAVLHADIYCRNHTRK